MGSRGDDAAVGVGEIEEDALGDEGVRRGGADVEAAEIGLAAAVDAVLGWGDLAAEAGDVRELDAVAEDVVALAIDAQTLHREELAVARDGLRRT